MARASPMDAYGALLYLMTRADFVSRGVMFRAASALRLRIRLPAPQHILELVCRSVRPCQRAFLMNMRALHPSDASHFLRLRLFGLLEAPSAFASSYQEEKGRTIEQVREDLTGSSKSTIFGGLRRSNSSVLSESGSYQRHCDWGMTTSMN